MLLNIGTNHYNLLRTDKDPRIWDLPAKTGTVPWTPGYPKECSLSLLCRMLNPRDSTQVLRLLAVVEKNLMTMTG